MNFREAENKILERYAEILSNKGYGLEREPKLRTWKDYWIIPDAVIKDEKDNIVSIIEIENNSHDNARVMHEIETIALSENIKFYIIIRFISKKGNTTSYIQRLYSTKAKTSTPIKTSKNEEGISQIIGELIDKYNTKFSSNDIKSLENVFKEGINQFLQHNDIINSQKLRELIDAPRNEPIIQGNDPFYFEPSFEEKFFKIFFPPQKIDETCRYTSFNVLFDILRNQKIRMNGICGMNDKSEIDYVEKYIYKHNTNNDRDEITNINNTFILSCCKAEKKDNLTMWRLYGDDAKGVNLIFDIKDENTSNNFYLAEVTYDQKILNLLKEIVNIFDQKRSKFIFKQLYYYRHFFKSKDYKEEKEIRLLYKWKNKIQKHWQIAQNFNILNPYIEINIHEFPLQLREIILGPTLKEQIINKKQLESFLIENGYHNIKISPSEIEHYRNSY
ncbi:DUF2971 domain-containing protein [Candidatus Avelusimicrobium fimicolum]|uniref:DUF2971 domain-containing protein n=1 Tax=Candidatus Avelusimicrobium fimicolum TaxID=3416216 RepID=UPI003D0D87B5